MMNRLHQVAGVVALLALLLGPAGCSRPVDLEVVTLMPCGEDQLPGDVAHVGYEILRGIDFSRPVAEIVLQHHERVDGSGYPRGLVGEDTLLEARILAVADVVEAMSSHRPYRPALGVDVALEAIAKHRGTLYDTRVVDACLCVFSEKEFAFDGESDSGRQTPG